MNDNGVNFAGPIQKSRKGHNSPSDESKLLRTIVMQNEVIIDYLSKICENCMVQSHKNPLYKQSTSGSVIEKS